MMKLYTNGDWRKTKLFDDNGIMIEYIKEIAIISTYKNYYMKLGGNILPFVPYNNIVKINVIKYVILNGYPIGNDNGELKTENIIYDNVLICRLDE